jgi:hemerythrin-like domain-containing protein
VSQIHPVQFLLDDHRVIEDVLNAFERKLAPLPEGALPVFWLADALRFFRRFVEGCHHNREETLIFPYLRVAGLLEEHESGERYVQRLEAHLAEARKGDREAVIALRRDGLAYAQLLREHIRKEDVLLHEVARQPGPRDEINRLYEEASPEQFHEMTDNTYEDFLALADALCSVRAA